MSYEDCKHYGEVCLLKGDLIIPDNDCKNCKDCKPRERGDLKE